MYISDASRTARTHLEDGGLGAVVLHRIRVEERALAEALGEPYRRYRESTRRLIPWVF